MRGGRDHWKYKVFNRETAKKKKLFLLTTLEEYTAGCVYPTILAVLIILCDTQCFQFYASIPDLLNFLLISLISCFLLEYAHWGIILILGNCPEPLKVWIFHSTP